MSKEDIWLSLINYHKSKSRIISVHRYVFLFIFFFFINLSYLSYYFDARSFFFLNQTLSRFNRERKDKVNR